MRKLRARKKPQKHTAESKTFQRMSQLVTKYISATSAPTGNTTERIIWRGNIFHFQSVICRVRYFSSTVGDPQTLFRRLSPLDHDHGFPKINPKTLNISKHLFCYWYLSRGFSTPKTVYAREEKIKTYYTLRVARKFAGLVVPAEAPVVLAAERVVMLVPACKFETLPASCLIQRPSIRAPSAI